MTITDEGTITAQTNAEILAYAAEVYRKAQSYRIAIWSAPAIMRAMDDLRDAGETYDALNANIIHPGRIWPELEHEDEAYAIGLDRAAANVAELTGELIRLFPACEVKAEGE
jgi:hypothetical protein